MTDSYGTVYCARREGGGIMRDAQSNVVCGIGYCTTDFDGRVRCSTRPGGMAMMDAYGNVQCAGGCMDARDR